MRVRALLVVTAAILLPTAAASPAVAHGGAAAFEVLEAEEVAPGTVALQVAVTFEADGDEATGAIVEVVPTSPDGEASPPVRLEQDGTGAYAATLDLPEPGGWTLALTSSFPPGSAEVPVEVGDPAPADDEAGQAPAVEAAASEPDASGGDEVLDEPEVGGAEGGSDATNLVVAAISGVIGGALGLWVSRRRSARRRAASTD